MANGAPLERQVALVTGASSGIGRAVATALGRAGANVVVNHLDQPDAAREVVAEIESLGRSAIALQADVSREEDVIAMFADAVRELGTIDILVNNAGIQSDAPLVDMTLGQWRTVIDVNLTGQFLCAREAAREFLRRGVCADISRAAGKIISISSVHERIPWAGHANYAASKGGVMQLMKSMAQELARYAVRVNGIAPGAIKTAINRQAWSSPEAEASLLRLIPYGRIGLPADVARVAVWLASDESDYLQGETIFVDGGMALYPAFAESG